MATQLETKTVSTFGTLNWKDLGKGFVIAIGTAIATSLIQILQKNNLPTLEQLKAAGITGLSAGIVYLLKNLFSGPIKQ